MQIRNRGIYRKIKQIIGKKYENEKFWKKFGVQYYEKFKDKKEWVINQERDLIRLLDKYQFNSILEVGCGFGRVTKVLLENYKVSRYLAFDISHHQIENAKKYCDGLNVEFLVSSISDFEIKEKFDLVICPEVLMHIPPNEIDKSIKKITSFSQKYLIFTAPLYDQTQKVFRATNTFYHDYEKIFKNINFDLTTLQSSTHNHIYFSNIKENRK